MSKTREQERPAAADDGDTVAVPREELAGILARLDVQDRQIAELKSAAAAGPKPPYGLKEGAPVDPAALTGQAQPAPPDPRHAVGERGEGKKLWACSLQGHKSRVVDAARGVAVLVHTLPVWGENRGEAEQEFRRYNGICSTIHTIEITPMPAQAA